MQPSFSSIGSLDLFAQQSDYFIAHMRQRPQHLLDHLPPESQPHAEFLAHVGSRFTCNPAPINTDYDIVILTKRLAFFTPLKDHGWEACGGYDDLTEAGAWKKRDKNAFTSYRKRDVNIICMYNDRGYNLFVRTALLAKELNLQHKHQRIILFARLRGWQQSNVKL